MESPADTQRAEQVETLLKTQDGPSTSQDGSRTLPVSIDGPAKQQPSQRAAATANFTVADASIGIASSRDMDRWPFNGESPNGGVDEFNFGSSMALNMGDADSTFTWEMIGLGLEEPLPPQETIDEL